MVGSPWNLFYTNRSRTPVGSWPVNLSSEELANRSCTGFLLFPLSLPHALPGASTLPSRNYMLESPCLLVCFLGDQPKILDDWETSKRKTLHSMLSFSLILNHKNVLIKINWKYWTLGIEWAAALDHLISCTLGTSLWLEFGWPLPPKFGLPIT